MLTAIYKIISVLAIALGLIHVCFAAVNPNFDLNVLWFIGAGLAIIFAGFINLIFIRPSPKDWLTRALCLIANFTLTILFVVAYFTVLNEPQVVVGILLFGAATVFSLRQKNA